MTQAFRLPAGGRIDRSCRITFFWDGRPLQGYAGDTLASALLANGVHFVARSFKYHRPRGIVAAGPEEPNALVTVRGDIGREDPNTPATRIALREGLRAFSQNCWPTLKHDFYALNGATAPVWPAGFYYKTFMWPRAAWKALYEPMIRRAAGLGRAPSAPDPDWYSSRFAHCDVLVVGAGPAGLAAARAAAECGASVILCDDQNEFGGSVLSCGREPMEGRHGLAWVEEAARELRSGASVTCLTRTTAFGCYAGNFVGLLEDLGEHAGRDLPRQRLWQVRARQVVLAAGAMERPLVFPDNDRPGILLAGAARSYANRYAVSVGSDLTVYAAHDSGYEAAFDIHDRGCSVRAVVDPRPAAPGELLAAARSRGIEVLSGHAVVATRGRRRVREIIVRDLASARAARKLACDTLLMAGGWTPTVHLFSQARGRLQWSPAIRAFVPAGPVRGMVVAGACRGIFAAPDVIADGERAGQEAACAAGCHPPQAMRVRPRAETSGESSADDRPSHLHSLHALAARGKAFVDFQNDVCASDIALAIREGFQSIEHLKRYTTSGMATDQGKTSNLNALDLAAGLLGQPAAALGTTTFRAPYTPITFGALAAEHRGMQLDPVRCTPIHAWAERQGAVFEPVGLWQRARYFPRAGESMHEAVQRECRITRERAGLFDASTLGKVEVVGPDAAEFLDRMYTNAWTRLEPGRCRYGLLLKENGFIFDDGVVGRLAHDRFHLTTTTGGAPRVLHHMEDYLQTEFADLEVWLTSVTEEWAVFAVNGPRARYLLEPLVEGIELSPQAFPHMALREGRICGAPTRLFRVSFTGELGFEVNVPASAAAAVWEQLQRSGAQHDAVTYGTETMHVLRAEKGYIIVGQETDGTVTPDDLGLHWAVGKAKPDFVGKRSLARSDLAREGRRQLVGLLTRDTRTLLEEGLQILTAKPTRAGLPSAGHVTSSYRSVAAGRPIALALLEDGRKRIGSTVHLPLRGHIVEADVVSPVFYDPEGGRLHV